jgi:hypothetical protein
MATVTKGRTFSSGEVVTPSKLNTLVDSATVTGIVNADVSATAAIADSKLATISTAGKVSNSATTATSANTFNAIVARNSTGGFTAGTIVATLSGNATTATTATTANAIADGAVSTAAKIANGVVTLAKLGSTEQDLVAKCWINFNGDGPFSPNPSTAAIRSQHNVSSVTYNGLGDYTVNFANNMSNASYAVVLGGSNNSGGSPGTAMIFSTATSQVRIWQKNTLNTAFFDGSFLCVAIFGN